MATRKKNKDQTNERKLQTMANLEKEGKRVYKMKQANGKGKKTERKKQASGKNKEGKWPKERKYVTQKEKEQTN